LRLASTFVIPFSLYKESETDLTQPSHVIGTAKRVCFKFHQPPPILYGLGRVLCCEYCEAQGKGEGERRDVTAENKGIALTDLERGCDGHIVTQVCIRQ
jgi:hypothetical protein